MESIKILNATVTPAGTVVLTVKNNEAQPVTIKEVWVGNDKVDATDLRYNGAAWPTTGAVVKEGGAITVEGQTFVSGKDYKFKVVSANDKAYVYPQPVVESKKVVVPPKTTVVTPAKEPAEDIHILGAHVFGALKAILTLYNAGAKNATINQVWVNGSQIALVNLGFDNGNFPAGGVAINADGGVGTIIINAAFASKNNRYKLVTTEANEYTYVGP